MEVIWQTVLVELRPQMPEATFQTWVADTQLIACNEDKAVVCVPNPHARDWFANRFCAVVKRSLAACLEYPVGELVFVDTSHDPLMERE